MMSFVTEKKDEDVFCTKLYLELRYNQKLPKVNLQQF